MILTSRLTVKNYEPARCHYALIPNEIKWDVGLCASVHLAFVRPFPHHRRMPLGPLALSVVIPTLGRPTLRATLDSLLRARGSESIEIIVAGDWPSSSESAPLDRFMAEHPQIRHLRIHFDDGDSSRKKNAGWQMAASELVAFMDDDVLVPPEWIERIRACFTAPEVGLASGPGLVPDDLPLFAWLAGHTQASRASGYVADRYQNRSSGPAPARWSAIIGCNMAFRRSVLEAIDGFPAEFWPGEEMKAAHEAVRSLGWTLMFDPGAGLHHYPRQSLRGFGRQMFTYGATRIRLLRSGVQWEWTPLVPAAGMETMFWLALAAIWFPIAGWIALGLAALYALALLAFALLKWRECGARAMLLPPLMAFMHLAYALGAWSEVFRPGRDFGKKPGSTKR